MLKRKTDFRSVSVGSFLRNNICEKPLSTTTRAKETRAIKMATTFKSSGIKRRKISTRTTNCTRAVSTFSPNVHSALVATCSLSLRILTTFEMI